MPGGVGLCAVFPLDIAAAGAQLHFAAIGAVLPVAAGDGGKGNKVFPFAIGLALIAPLNGGAVVSQFDFPAVLPLQIGEGKQIVPLGIGVVLPLDIAVCHLKLDFLAIRARVAGDGGKGHQVAPFGIGLALIFPLNMGVVCAKFYLLIVLAACAGIGAHDGNIPKAGNVGVPVIRIHLKCHRLAGKIGMGVIVCPLHIHRYRQ